MGGAHEERERAVGEVDDERLRLDAAIKSDDGFFTTFFVSSWSPRLVRGAAKAGLTPNAVTGFSMALGLLAALWFSAGTRGPLLFGAVLLYLSFVLDCVDGQLARYTGRFSSLGAWLDVTFDRAKEFVVYAGLAAGAMAAGVGNVWPYAVAAMVLQAVRHMIDLAYLGPRAERAPTRPAGEGVAKATRWNMMRRYDAREGLYWVKKIIVLPIGERFALIAITAAFFNARVTFLALLAWGSIAACYTAAGRIARSFAQ